MAFSEILSSTCRDKILVKFFQYLFEAIPYLYSFSKWRKLKLICYFINRYFNMRARLHILAAISEEML